MRLDNRTVQNFNHVHCDLSANGANTGDSRGLNAILHWTETVLTGAFTIPKCGDAERDPKKMCIDIKVPSKMRQSLKTQ